MLGINKFLSEYLFKDLYILVWSLLMDIKQNQLYKVNYKSFSTFKDFLEIPNFVNSNCPVNPKG